MKRLFSTLAIGLLFLTLAVPARAEDDGPAAEEMKPLLVASFAGFGELVDDLNFVGEVSNIEDLGTSMEGMLEMLTQGQGLAGIDRDRPWGLVVSTNGGAFQILGFVPLSDLEGFLDVVGAILGKAEDHGDGIYSVDLPDAIPGTEQLPLPIAGQSVYFKQQGEWTFVSIGPEFLVDLPEDPVALLGDLKDQYDLGAKNQHSKYPGRHPLAGGADALFRGRRYDSAAAG